MKKKKELGKCPLCNYHYGGQRHYRTKHHLFPKFWFNEGLTVFACHTCHTREFHQIYPMDLSGRAWTKRQCLKYWVDFCNSKGVDAFKVYPQLRSYQHMLY